MDTDSEVQCRLCGRVRLSGTERPSWQEGDGRPCDECGGASRDFGDQGTRAVTETGSKARQRNFAEGGARTWSDWHRDLPRYCYMVDGDHFIYTYDPQGAVSFIAMMETTHIPGNMPLRETYLPNLEKRFRSDAQYKVLLAAAEQLGIPLLMTAHREDLSEFWVRNYSGTDGLWYPPGRPERRGYTETEYQAWLVKLHRRKPWEEGA